MQKETSLKLIDDLRRRHVTVCRLSTQLRFQGWERE